MRVYITLLVFLPAVLQSCDYRKSVKTDPATGLFSQGDGLSCEDVDITVNENKVKSTTFSYGQKLFLNFRDIEGFTRINDAAFPGMELYVINSKGDTVIQDKDLYKDHPEGYTISPLLLNAHLICASPVHSQEKYIMYTRIWDKKGKGSFSAHFSFEVVPDKNIKITSNKVSHKEVYLFSQAATTSVLDGKISLNEKVYLLFEGLDGFTVQNDSVFPGVSIKATAADGTGLLNDADVFPGDGLPYKEFHAQMSPNIVFTKSGISNPVSCEIVIWDKKGDAKIAATFPLTIK